jgi:hypothetical protein
MGGRLVNADVHERAIRGGQAGSCENPRETESPGHVLDPHQRMYEMEGKLVSELQR